MSGLLDLLVPPRRLESESWHWATVTSLSPFRVRLDGEASELLAVPENLTGAARTVGERVWVQRYGRRLLVHGGPEVFDTGWIQTGWTLGTGWTSESYQSWVALAYRVKNGICWVNGTAKKTSWSAMDTIVTLPVGARPRGQFQVSDVRAYSTGEIKAVPAGSTVIGIDIQFPVDG